MMKNLSLRLKLHLPSPSNPSCSTLQFLKPIKATVVSCNYNGKNLKHQPSKFAITQAQAPPRPITLKHRTPVEHSLINLAVSEDNKNLRIVIVGAVSVGVFLLWSGMEDQKAWALGPEGPLVEEFWDNVRRYGLYALTVSTGALYTIFQPIFELLKNPISALLIIAIFAGSFYILSQVLSAMFGVSEFAYEYGY
ncbi:uncharacterized protein LOC130715620 [Lotus japonicus]|uniref:uncharacterized protein LOC130715620 n=1 Tax=Lotus japonicus TaxID=34305 RepID=UPI00258A6DB0|nr:uncharacterized protein LOC130715620 [Lotus japonicus]